MPANTSPIFTLTPVVGRASISTANANRDGTGTLGTVVTGGTNGTRIDRVVVKARVQTTAGMIRFFVYDGSNYFFVHEISVSAITPSATVQAFESEWVRTDDLPLLVLPTNYVLKVATEQAEAFDVTAYGGDY